MTRPSQRLARALEARLRLPRPALQPALLLRELPRVGDPSCAGTAPRPTAWRASAWTAATTRSPFNSARESWPALVDLIGALPTPWVILSINDEGFHEPAEVAELLGERGHVAPWRWTCRATSARASASTTRRAGAWHRLARARHRVAHRVRGPDRAAVDAVTAGLPGTGAGGHGRARRVGSTAVTPDLLFPLAASTDAAGALTDLFIVLLAAKLGDELFKRIHQPTVVGEILAGVIVGPSVLGLVDLGEVLEVFAELGVIFLLFWVGLETRPLRPARRRAASRCSSPCSASSSRASRGFALGEAARRGHRDRGVLRGRARRDERRHHLRGARRARRRRAPGPGRTILAAAVVDDILAILVLSVAVGIAADGSVDAGDIALTAGLSVAFVGFVALGGRLAAARAPRAADRAALRRLAAAARGPPVPRASRSSPARSASRASSARSSPGMVIARVPRPRGGRERGRAALRVLPAVLLRGDRHPARPRRARRRRPRCCCCSASPRSPSSRSSPAAGSAPAALGAARRARRRRRHDPARRGGHHRREHRRGRGRHQRPAVRGHRRHGRPHDAHRAAGAPRACSRAARTSSASAPVQPRGGPDDAAARDAPAAVIFDNDGLTLNSEIVWTRAEEKLFARRGRVSRTRTSSSWSGRAGPTPPRNSSGCWGRTRGPASRSSTSWRLVVEELQRGCKAMPGALDLIAALRAAGRSRSRSARTPRGGIVDAALGGSGLDGVFPATIAGDEVEARQARAGPLPRAAAALSAPPRPARRWRTPRPGAAGARAAGMGYWGSPRSPA